VYGIAPVAEPPIGDQLAALVARTDPGALLPARYVGEPVTGFELVAGVDLVDGRDGGAGLMALVLRSDRGGLYAAPAVVDQSADPPSRRAAPGDGASPALLRLLATGLDHGPVADGFTLMRLFASGDLDQERPMLVDQTHESVVVGEHAVVKWSVRAEPTPAPRLVAHLAEAGFEQMPRPVGFVAWTPPGGSSDDEVLVASAMSFLPGASDGWSWAVADAGEHARGRAELTPATSAFTEVGVMVADLHVAMSTPTNVLPSPRRQAGREQLDGWHELADRLLDEAVLEVDGPEGSRLRNHEPRVRDALTVLDGLSTTPVIPVHGDLHVGQVLRWDGGYAVGDFDGNPVLPVAARLLPQPAARDVAGMLQSIDHVGRVVDRRVEGADPTRTARWIEVAQDVFLDAYRSRLAAAGASDLLDSRLLLPFRFEQECREFLYAVRHLDRWRYVADQALTALLVDDADD
jgi:maltokinase